MVTFKRKRYSDASTATHGASTGSPKSKVPAHPPPDQTAARAPMERDLNKFEVRWQKGKAGAKPLKRRKLNDDWTDGKEEDGIHGAKLGGVYQVKPGSYWNQLGKYRNFIVAPRDGDDEYEEAKHKFQVGDFVFVNHTTEIESNADSSDNDERQNWVARIAEVRAASAEAVFIRVIWMYWPEELPGGKETYHGRRELVASNLMDILDAMTVDGKAKVEHYRQEPRDKNRDHSLFGNLEPSTYYWRQTFNTLTSKLSTLPKDCHCKQISNLDEPLYECPHAGCKRWFHAHCTEDAALDQYWQRIQKKGQEELTNGHSLAEQDATPNGAKSSEEESEMGDTIITTPRKSQLTKGNFFKNLFSTLSGQTQSSVEETRINTSLATRIKETIGNAPAQDNPKAKKHLDAEKASWKDDFATELIQKDGRFTGKVKVWPANLSATNAAEDGLVEVVEVMCLDEKCGRSLAATASAEEAHTETTNGARVNGGAVSEDRSDGQDAVGRIFSDAVDKARANSGFDAVKDAAFENARPGDESPELEKQAEMPLVYSTA